MAEEKKEVSQELSLLDELKQQHTLFCTQRDQAQINLQQLIGAIYSIELVIKKIEEKEIEDDSKKK